MTPTHLPPSSSQHDSNLIMTGLFGLFSLFLEIGQMCLLMAAWMCHAVKLWTLEQQRWGTECLADLTCCRQCVCVCVSEAWTLSSSSCIFTHKPYEVFRWLIPVYSPVAFSRLYHLITITSHLSHLTCHLSGFVSLCFSEVSSETATKGDGHLPVMSSSLTSSKSMSYDLVTGHLKTITPVILDQPFLSPQVWGCVCD